jgi:hypothetical protein
MQFPEAATAVIDQAINFVYSFGPLAEKTVVLGTCIFALQIHLQH